MTSLPAACMTLHEGVVYGPIHSRRFGVSLGVNLLPPSRKVCSFNCVYCQYSWTEPLRSYEGLAWPAPDVVVEATLSAVARMRDEGRPPDRLTIAGHGEPTLHPEFPAVVDALCAARDARAPGLPIAILSNSTTAHVPAIRAALSRLDERNMKLDAGRQQELRQVNATATPIEQILTALEALPGIAIQAMFVRDAQGRIDNTTPEAIEAWLEAVARIQPRAVQIYTIARAPALGSLLPVDASVLKAIAAQVEARGIEALAVV